MSYVRNLWNRTLGEHRPTDAGGHTLAGMTDEPKLTEDERTAFLRGVDEFNRGYFFECHDTLEEVWHGLRDDSRDFFQGLIQISVGCYHYQDGNRRGAESQWRKGLARLGGYGRTYLGIDLVGLRRAIGALLVRLDESTTAPPMPHISMEGRT